MRFLALPRELRDAVYFHALAPSEIDDSRPYNNSHFVRHYIPGAALLRVNRQVHDEAADVLYGTITFEFTVGSHPFLLTIGATNAARIRHLAIYHRQIGTWFPTLQFDMRRERRLGRCSETRRLLAENCTGLQTLMIVGTRAKWFAEPDLWERTTTGLDVINRELVSRLPALKRTVLQMRGTTEQLESAACAPLVTRARELGWEICERLEIPGHVHRRCHVRTLAYPGNAD